MKGFPKVPLYDATVLIREGMLTFPGDPPFKIDSFFSRANGDPFDLALMSIGTHLGTHVDPPAHYLDGGATVDQIPLDVMVGPGIVMDMRGRRQIDRWRSRNRIYQVLDFIESNPENRHLVLTGRNAHPEVIAKAHTVSEVKEIKHAMQGRDRAAERN
jgi:kynurenine formamidase